jgi:hypothetical protein
LAKPMKQSKSSKHNPRGLGLRRRLLRALRLVGENCPRLPQLGAVRAMLQCVQYICMPRLHMTKKLFHLSLTESAPKALPYRRLSQNPLTLLLSKVRPCEVFIFCLYKVVIFIFIDAIAVVDPGLALANARMKDLGHEDVDANETLTADGLAYA